MSKVLIFFKKNRFYNNLLFFILNLLLIFFCTKNIFLVDTTSDKRYSLQESSKKIVENLDKELVIELYLDGELPIELKYLRSCVEDLVFSLNKCVKKVTINLKYVNIDNIDEDVKESIIKKFRSIKIYPTTFQYKKGNKTVEKNIYPAAILKYDDKEEIILLLKSTSISNLPMMLESSIENLEYEIVSGIETLATKKKYKVGIVRDHGTPSDLEISSLLHETKKYYDYKPIIMAELNKLSKDDLDLLILVRPTKSFSDYELYILDQFIIGGGKALFFIDTLSINPQEMYEGRNFATPISTGIEDLLYKYGIVLQNDLVEDLQCSVHPYIVGYLGNQPQLKLIPWTFNPILTHFTIHPVIRNIDSILARFVSRITTIEIEDIVHYGIIYTSSNTLAFEAPFIINTDRLYKAPIKELYNYGYIPISTIAEGRFTSAFANEILLPEGVEKSNFLKKSAGSQIFVASTSSLITNYKNPSTGKSEELGRDPFLNKDFSNLTFLKNLLRFFTNADGAIGLEKKSYKIRLLDKIYVEENRLILQIASILSPVIILFFIGVIFNTKRRKKYENL